MNLAIEYMIRSGELHSNVKFPISVFIRNADTNEKRVVTVSEAFNGNRLTVKHWLLGDCTADDMVPPVKGHEISRDDLYTSEHTVVPSFDLYAYAPDPFRTGKKQHNKEPLASIDEEEYTSHFNFFYNSKKHQSGRAGWLWFAFKAAYKFDHKGYFPARSDGGTYGQLLKREAPHLYKKWAMWRKYMLDFSVEPGAIAGELPFHQEYKLLMERENRKPKPPEPFTAGGSILYSLFNIASSWQTNISYNTVATTGTINLGSNWNNYYYAG